MKIIIQSSISRTFLGFLLSEIPAAIDAMEYDVIAIAYHDGHVLSVRKLKSGAFKVYIYRREELAP